MSIIDYHVEDLVNRLRAYANDSDEEILALWEELINADIVSILAHARHKELQKFQEWVIGNDSCVSCGKILPRLEMYSYQARTMVKVKYSHRYFHLWQNASGACYDCQKQYLDNHTYTCIDCGSPIFGHAAFSYVAKAVKKSGVKFFHKIHEPANWDCRQI
jgi:hypothetical protein